MASRIPAQISRQSIGQFDPNTVLPRDQPLAPSTRRGLKEFLANTIIATGTDVPGDAAAELIGAVANFDREYPLFSSTPFRYAAIPELPKLGLQCTAESTVIGAIGNMGFLTSQLNPQTFAANSREARRGNRAVQWRAPIDEKYEIRVRGGSGAGTFSIDFGLGTYDPLQPWRYNELWRVGIDTTARDGQTGTRFVRTGSAIKPGEEAKKEAFKKFRKAHGLLPQRLLGIVGMYYMHEVKPDYALALTTKGAIELSTLGKSNNARKLNYTGIFQNIGFEPSDDERWSLLPNFSEGGFLRALDVASIRRREADALHTAVESLNSMQAINYEGEPLGIPAPFKLCSDNDRTVINGEIRAHMPPLAR